MKAQILFISLLTFFSFPLSAQQNLVGTWEHRNDSVWSIKIITPTHWMVYSETHEKRFNQAQGGTYTLKNNSYKENIEMSSKEAKGEIKSDFTIEIEGDKLYKTQSITNVNDAMQPVDVVWNKVKTPESYAQNPAIGIWNQLSSTYTLPDGSSGFHSNDIATRLLIVTPTHWIKMNLREGKFESISGGTYRMDGEKVFPAFDFTSHTAFKVGYTEIDQLVEGEKLYWKGFAKRTDGENPLKFDDEFEMVGQ